jgi:hypothetical protein
VEGLERMRAVAYRRGWLPRLLIAVAVAAGGVGCGDDSSAEDARGSTPAVALLPDPPQDHLIRIRRLALDARTPGDCRKVRRMSRPGDHVFPCPLSEEEAGDLRSLEVDASRAYGSGALVELNTQSHGDVTVVVRAARNGKWVVDRYAIPTTGNVDTSDADARPAFARALRAYLAAVRSGRCADYLGALAVLPGDSAKSDAQRCRAAREEDRAFALELRHELGARLDYMGGNRTFGFYGLFLEGNQTYWTISVMRSPDGRYGVLDAESSTLPNVPGA